MKKVLDFPLSAAENVLEVPPSEDSSDKQAFSNWLLVD